MITIETIEQTNYLLSIAGIVTLFGTAILLYDLYTKRLLSERVRKWGAWKALFIVVIGSALTLLYSEVFGVVPCGLCWLERMALYPQLAILGVGMYYKDKLMPIYGITLSIFGLIVSLYHHYLQMGGSEFIKCPVAGAGADCAKRFFFEFGFVTFPFMGVILFAFLIVLYVYMRKVN